jgi:hypothetical protein
MRLQFLINTLLASTIFSHHIYSVHSLIIPRSQGVRLSREFNARYRDQENEAAGSVTLTIERLRTFRSKQIAQCLFGSDHLTFSGSAVAQRRPTDLLADYFGLSPDFQGAISFRPRMDNLVVDLQYSLHLDCFKPGLFLTVDLPLARSKWDLRACATKDVSSSLFPACYMNTGTIAASPVLNLQEALSGTQTFGDMHRIWNFGKFSFCPQQRTRVTNVGLTLTYPLLYCQDIRLNALFNAAIPAGNKPDPIFIFSPLAGNGHFGTIGIGFNVTWHAWHSCNDTIVSGYLEGRMSHLFKHTNIRSFDFRQNGPLSRYMLLKEFVYTSTTTLSYDDELINAINFNTRPACVSVPLEGELLAALIVENDCWYASGGYTLYGRTSEQLDLRCGKPACDILHKLFGIKGTENVCTVVTSTTTPVNTTQSNATIFSGGTPDAQPTLVYCCDLDPDSARVPHQLTHTFFAQATYQWNHCCMSPYLGIGCETEFAASSAACSISQWGIWLSGGILF